MIPDSEYNRLTTELKAVQAELAEERNQRDQSAETASLLLEEKDAFITEMREVLELVIPLANFASRYVAWQEQHRVNEVKKRIKDVLERLDA